MKPFFFLKWSIIPNNLVFMGLHFVIGKRRFFDIRLSAKEN